MKIINKNKILIAIVLLSAVIRLYKLGSIPPHLTPDEASLGYNAYSILKTGKDEYGVHLPIIFKSFGDFKPGLYIYTAIPSIAVLGLNEFSVRLPSAVFGIIGIVCLYFILKELFNTERLSIIASFILAVSPWHILFSRGAWEINLSLTLTLLGILFFLKSLVKHKYLPLSAILFALTLAAYQGAKLSTGIVIAILVCVYFKKVIKIPQKTLIVSFLLGFLVVLPIIFSFFNGQTGRLTVFSVFSYPRGDEYVNNFLSESGVKKGTLSYYLFYSEAQNFARGILGRWFNHFSGRFLFFEGDWSNPRHSPPYQGVLLLSDVVPLVIGLIVLIRKKAKKERLVFLLWLILAPLPAVLSRDQIHAVRSYNMVIPITVVLAFGVDWLLSQRKLFTIPFLIAIYTFGVVYFLDAFFVHLPVHQSQLWEYGYKQIVETIAPLQNKFEHIYVQQSYSQPYIYFLFYEKFDPSKYQAQSYLSENLSGDVGQVSHLGNVSFVPVDWSIIRGEKGSIVVGDPTKIPVEDSKEGPEFHIVNEIPYLNGKEIAFRIIEIKK